MLRKSLLFLSLGALALCPGVVTAQDPSLVLKDGGIEFPDGSLQTTAAGSYDRVLVVAKSGGDFTSIQEALDSIPPPPVLVRTLVFVAPGVYDEQVTMRPFTDIQGSGESLTIISWVGDSSIDSGTVVGANRAELRYLTVENRGGDAYGIGIFNSGASPKLTHITVIASGADSSYGVRNRLDSNPLMTHVMITASGGTDSRGVHNSDSSPTMSYVTAIATGGRFSSGVLNLSSSPTMTNVTAIASGGTSDNRGVDNVGSSPRMSQVIATSSGGSTSRAVMNRNSSPILMQVTATATGPWNTVGVYSWDSSSPRMVNVTATASGGANLNYAVANYGTTRPGVTSSEIHGSWLSGSTAAIFNQVEDAAAKVATSMLDGGVQGPGFTCFAVYDQDLDALGSDCRPP